MPEIFMNKVEKSSHAMLQSDEGKDSGIYLDQQKVMESLLSQEPSSSQFCDDPLSSFVESSWPN